MVLVTLLFADCGSAVDHATSSTEVPRQPCATAANCLKLAREMGFDGSSTLQAPPNIADEFQTGWYVLPGHAFGRGVFVLNYLDKKGNFQLQENAFPGLHLKPCPSGNTAISPGGTNVCFIIDTAMSGSFVTFFRSGFAYQISLNGGRTITTEAQKSVLLGLVDQLQPA